MPVVTKKQPLPPAWVTSRRRSFANIPTTSTSLLSRGPRSFVPPSEFEGLREVTPKTTKKGLCTNACASPARRYSLSNDSAIGLRGSKAPSIWTEAASGPKVETRTPVPSSAASTASSSTAWDLKSRFMHLARTGPTPWPAHIQNETKDFDKAAPSPLLMYYYDETAPNDVLLANDVLHKGATPAKEMRRKLKRFIFCQGGERERQYEGQAAEYSATFSDEGYTDDDEDDVSTSAGYTSSDYGQSSRPEERPAVCCGPKPPKPTPIPDIPQADGLVSSSSSSYPSFTDDLTSSYTTTTSEVFNTDPKTAKATIPDPYYGPDQTMGSAPSPLPMLEGEVCPKCKGRGYITDHEGRRAQCWCCGPAVSSYDNRTRDLPVVMKPTTGSRPCCGNVEDAQSESSSSFTTYTESLSFRSNTVPHKAGGGRSGGCCGVYPAPVQPPEPMMESLETTEDEEGPYKPVNKTERERDLGYHVRKMFFSAEEEAAIEECEYKQVPTYSVSYKNYPYIAYDAIIPTNYSDFFRVKQRPMCL